MRQATCKRWGGSKSLLDRKLPRKFRNEYLCVDSAWTPCTITPYTSTKSEVSNGNGNVVKVFLFANFQSVADFKLQVFESRFPTCKSSHLKKWHSIPNVGQRATMPNLHPMMKQFSFPFSHGMLQSRIVELATSRTDHWCNNWWRASIEIFSLAYMEIVLSYNMQRFACIVSVLLVPCGQRNPFILDIFALDSPPKSLRWNRPLSQASLVVGPSLSVSPLQVMLCRRKAIVLYTPRELQKVQHLSWFATSTRPMHANSSRKMPRCPRRNSV